jgi:hypothetical protein
MHPITRAAGVGAAITALTLFGGILAGFVFVEIVSGLVPNPDFDNLPVTIVLAVMGMHIAGVVVGGAAWGIGMGRLTSLDDRRRLARAGLLGFVPATAVGMIVLGALEGPAIGTTNLPVNRIFTVLFVPAAFAIAGIAAWTFGRALDDPALARRLFWQVGLAAGLAFLVVNLTLDWTGWVIGAPGARARSTMITVTLVANLAAAVVGGAVMGVELTRAP